MIFKKVILPALLTSLLLSLPFIFEILFFLIFVSIACLLYFHDQLNKRIHKIMFVVTSISLWHFIVLFWLYYDNDKAVTIWDITIIIFFLISVLLFFLFAFTIFHKTIRKLRFFIFIIFWIIYEIMLVEWDIPFQMLSLGTVLGGKPSLIQWYSVTGVMGGTLWVLLVNYFVLRYMKTYRKSDLRYMLYVFIIPFLVSLTMLFIDRGTNRKTANVIAVNLKFENNNNFERVLGLLENETDSTTQIIVCPEGIVDLPTSSFPINKYFSTFKRLLNSKYKQACIIFGCELKIGDTFDNQNPEYYNLAVQCNNQGFVNFRNKKVLVPFGEFIPYPEYLGKISRIRNAVTKEISYNEAYDTVFIHSELRILPLICYEQNFGNKIRRYFHKHKPNIITCIANEYAVPNKLYNTQFNRLAIIQAISFRTPVIKSAINGYASIINGRGKQLKSRYNSNEVIKEDIEIQTNRTIYAQFGYYPVFVLVLLSYFCKHIKNLT
jgi:apolipoprotein N-acyltransferase